MPHIPLSHFTKLEKESHTSFLPDIESTLQKKLKTKGVILPKHIYLIHGEPRTGKTTLGQAAALSMVADILDTDQFEEETLVAEVSQSIQNFVQEKNKHLYFVILGKHRKHNEVILEHIQNITQKTVFITVCKTSLG